MFKRKLYELHQAYGKHIITENVGLFCQTHGLYGHASLKYCGACGGFFAMHPIPSVNATPNYFSQQLQPHKDDAKMPEPYAKDWFKRWRPFVLYLKRVQKP